MGEIWMWDIYFVHLVKVRRALVNRLNLLIVTVSRSNDYSKNLTPSPWKAILLSYVVVGKAMEYKTDHPSLTQPPTGFDSVRPTSLCPLKLICDCL